MTETTLQIKMSSPLQQISKWSFYFMLATFPLSLFLNNLFATVFLIAFGFYLLLSQKLIIKKTFKKNLHLFLILSVPFLLTLLGSIYSSNPSGALKMIGKIAPLLFFVYYGVYHKHWFSDKIKPAFWFLVIGCLLSAGLSWGLSLVEIVKLKLPISVLFTQEFAYHNLAEKLGIHTPYLALFINAALGFIVYSFYDKQRKISKPFLWFIFIVLTIFLFNLMARNAIFCYLFFGFIFLVKSKNYLLLLIFFVVISALTIYIYNTEKNFLRDRFIYGVNIFEEETIFSKKDNRFDRWQASVEVFKQFPILGPGTDAAKEFRKEQYLINLDSEAYNEGYNAHNQFFEYLSTYGLLGALLFILMVFYLIKITLQQHSTLLLYLLGCFLLAMVTESILVRSWGVMYYGFLIICIFSWNIKFQKLE